MKTMALLILLAASTLVASAQSPTVNPPDQPFVIHYVKVAGSTITYNTKKPSEYHDKFNGPDTTTTVGAGSVRHEPESYTSNEQAFLAHMESPKSEPKVTAQMFFCMVIENTSAKPIKALKFTLRATSRVTGAQYGPYEKRLRVNIKSGQRQTLDSDVALKDPPDEFLKGVYSEQNRYDLQLVGVEYADGSVWKRP